MTVSISSSVYSSSREIKFNSYLLNKWVGKLLYPVVSKVKYLINNQFDNLFIVSSGALDVADTYSPEVALTELSSIKKFLPSLRIMVSKLEKRDFFGDEVLREKVQITLDKFYELEGELRLKAYANNKKDRQKQPAEFINALADKSKSSLTAVLKR